MTQTRALNHTKLMHILPPPSPVALALALQPVPAPRLPSNVTHKSEVATLPPPKRRARRCR